MDKNKVLTAFVVDDETSARDNLSSLLSEFLEGVEVLGTAESPLDAIPQIAQLKPDVTFLDIDMPEMSGLDLARTIDTSQTCIVFITAFDKYAVEAFRRNAVDYLLKPVDLSQLEETVSRIQSWKTEKITQQKSKLENLLSQMQGENQPGKMALPCKGGFEIVTIQDISRVQADNSYATVWVGKDKYLLAKSIGEFERVLGQNDFFRIHNSHLINLNFLSGYRNEDGGIALMKDGSKIPIAKRRLSDFREVLKNRHANF